MRLFVGYPRAIAAKKLLVFPASKRVDLSVETNMQIVRVGVVGCGYWGPNLIRNFYENNQVEVRYVCDLDLDKLVRMHKRYPSVKPTTKFEKMLKDPEIDAIVIATPVHTHFQLARKALMANKHVLVEKPMCMTSTECRELIALAEERKRVLMVDHTFVYHGAVRRIKKEIDSGKLGELLYFDSVRINLGLFQSDINVIWDLAPHDLSVMDYLIGRTPLTVHATGASHTASGIEDIAYITLAFDRNLIAHFHVSWLSPVKIRQVLIGGTNQMIVYDDMTPMEKVRVYDKGITVNNPETEEERYQNLIQYRVGDMFAPNLDLSEALKVEVAHFVDCVLNGTKPLTDGYAGLRVVQILESANASLASKQPQELSMVGVK